MCVWGWEGWFSTQLKINVKGSAQSLEFWYLLQQTIQVDIIALLLPSNRAGKQNTFADHIVLERFSQVSGKLTFLSLPALNLKGDRPEKVIL